MDALQHSLGGYREYRVPPDLRGVANALWSYSRPEGAPPIPGAGHRVLPDTSLSLCLWSRRDARGRVSDPRIMLIAPMPSIHFFDPGPGTHIEAVRVEPEWSRDLLGIDPAEHLNSIFEWRGAPSFRDALSQT